MIHFAFNIPKIFHASAFLFLALGNLKAEEDSLHNIASTVHRIFQTHRSAVVQVEAEDSRGVIRGTGFYIDPVGTLYTLATIAADTKKIEILRDGKRFPAEVLSVDTRSGIAILHSEPGSVFLQPSLRNDLQIATPVLLIGYPLDLEVSPGFGLIAGFDKKRGNQFFSTTHLRVSLPVLRGQGGSPLLNLQGEVEGIVTSSVDDGATCYALPIRAAEKLRKDITRFGKIQQGWMGVVVANTETPQAGSLAIIDEIDIHGPAGKAGLQVGDIILQIGESPVTCREDILDASFFLTAGDVTKIKIFRNGSSASFDALPIQPPSTNKTSLQAGMELIPKLQP